MYSKLNIQGLKGIVEVIKRVCEAYPGLSFASGIEADFTNGGYAYPLAFLELPIQANVSGNKEFFDITLLIADRVGKEPNQETIINTQSKTEQILSEIHYQLDQLAHSLGVSDLNKLSFPNYSDNNYDGVIISRGEFQLDTPRYTARIDTPFSDIDLSDMID